MRHTSKHLFIVLGILMAVKSFGQDSLWVSDADTKYREDQFYVGITYNLLNKVPSNVNLKGVSGGIHFGYLRDMPINEERNLSIALGGGLAFDQYGQNLFIGELPNEETIFRPLLDDVSFTKNRLSMATLELPIEFRWRTSTATEYKFWRIYSGVRLGYTYWYKAYFKQTDNIVVQTDIPELQPINFAVTLAFGYGTFNFYLNYAITPFFNGATTVDTFEEIGFSPLKIGLIFYIL